MQTLRAGAYRPRSMTISAMPEPVDWNRRGLDETVSNAGRAQQQRAIMHAVNRGMSSAGMGGLSGGGCTSAGAQAGQAILGAVGAGMTMYGASQAASTKPTVLETDAGSKTVTNIPSSATNLQTAGTLTAAVGSAWTQACAARAEARAGETLAVPPPGLAPPPPAADTWIPGVSNNVVLAGVAVAAVGAFVMMRG